MMMATLHKRTETAQEVIILVPNWPRVVALAAIFGSVLVHDYNSDDGKLRGPSLALFVVGFCMLVWRRIDCHGVFSEIAAAMKAGSVQLSGSAYGPTGVQTYTIRKPTQDAPAQGN